MGMYTEVGIKAHLTQEGIAKLKASRALATFPTTTEWAHWLWQSAILERNELTIRSSFKNYDRDAEAVIKWVQAHVDLDDHHDPTDIIAYTWYEEDALPRAHRAVEPEVD